MARLNKGKPRKPRYKRSRPQVPKAKKPRRVETPASGTAKPSTAPPQQPKGEWVTLEHRDSEGNPTLPQHLISSTHARRYSEVEEDAEFRALILTAYKPSPLMLVERKIYQVQRLAVEGWRRRGQIHIELEGWRAHEKEWFAAMREIELEIVNATPGLPAKGDGYRVTSTSFAKKSVTIHGPDNAQPEMFMYGATLNITETWQSTWRRHRVQTVKRALLYVVLPLSVALAAGAANQWLSTPEDEDSQPSSPILGTAAEAPNPGNPPSPVQSDSPSSSSVHEDTAKENTS